MKTIPEIRHLITKNWFYSIALGTVLFTLKMILEHAFLVGEFRFDETFLILPITAIALPVILVLSTPALAAALISIPLLKQFAASEMRTRYHLCLIILVLSWGTSAIIVPHFLDMSLTQPEVYSVLCLLSFSFTFIFLNDEKLISRLSEDN
jgi:hypothetical protein